MRSPSPLCCPVCHLPLARKDGAFQCPGGHSFDRAKEGYLNLLLSHQRKSSHPGDDGAMIQARRRFFDSGAFNPALDTLRALIPATTKSLCDAGCGEGAFLGALRQRQPGDFYGVDVSKPAIKTAAKRYKNCHWLVANIMREIPLADHSMDAVLSVLAPRNPREFVRILKPGGQLVLGVPGLGHLRSVRDKLMPRVDDFGGKADEAVRKLGDHFQEYDRRTVDYSLRLSQAQLSDLVHMTPIFWNTSEQARQTLIGLPGLDVRISLVFIALRRIA